MRHCVRWATAVGCIVTAAARSPGGSPAITAVHVGEGLVNPVFLTHAPGDFNRLFVIEQVGRIKVMRDGDRDGEVFLDLTGTVSAGGERGLLGLAFHPDYATNGHFFVDYTDRLGDLVISRFTVSANPDVADPLEHQLLWIDHPDIAENHNGGWISFGGDGFLYISVGDGGTPSSNAQDITDNLLGKILRIDVNGDDFPADAWRNYAIPPGNPLLDRDDNDEIWAYGLRNPWRAGFDPLTFDLYIADVGASFWEEIDFLPAGVGGANFGWPTMEGFYCGPDLCSPPELTLPIHSYSSGDPEPACAVIGGYVYRGCAIPHLAGAYFFGDTCSGQVWSFRYGGSVTQLIDRTSGLAPPGHDDFRPISSFGLDAAGELYICNLTGDIYKVVPDAPPAIASSVPPHGAIDARRPLSIDGSVVLSGWTGLTLSMNAPPACIRQEQFYVSQQGGIGPPPQVQSMTVSQSDPRDLETQWTRAIEAGSWTQIVHEDSLTRVRLGALPGDVNADATSNIDDVTALVNVLRGNSPPLPLWLIDLDRSETITPADIQTAVDLLNGEGIFPPYNGASLP